MAAKTYFVCRKLVHLIKVAFPIIVFVKFKSFTWGWAWTKISWQHFEQISGGQRRGRSRRRRPSRSSRNRHTVKKRKFKNKTLSWSVFLWFVQKFVVLSVRELFVCCIFRLIVIFLSVLSNHLSMKESSLEIRLRIGRFASRWLCFRFPKTIQLSEGAKQCFLFIWTNFSFRSNFQKKKWKWTFTKTILANPNNNNNNMGNANFRNDSDSCDNFTGSR